MKKILYVASTYGHILNFHIPYIKALQEKGYVVDVSAAATNSQTKKKLLGELKGIRLFDMPFAKKMFSLNNMRCTKQLISLIGNGEYDIVSVHTSLAAFFVRLAIMLAFPYSKARPTVICTVHGYLFDAKTHFIKRILLLGAEKLTKPATNHLLVMNSEDYRVAESHHLYKDSLSMVLGMGIDNSRFSTSNFSDLDRSVERIKLGFQPEDLVMIYAAEFSKRKNQKMLLAAMKMLPNNVKLILAGQGEQLEACKKISNALNLNGLTESKNTQLAQSVSNKDRVFFVGHVNDLEYYYFISDICVSSSRIEGLPFNIMEALAMGLPVIATRVKGHTDLVVENENGFLYDFDSVDGFCSSISKVLAFSPQKYKQIAKSNESIAVRYYLETVLGDVMRIYP